MLVVGRVGGGSTPHHQGRGEQGVGPQLHVLARRPPGLPARPGYQAVEHEGQTPIRRRHHLGMGRDGGVLVQGHGHPGVASAVVVGAHRVGVPVVAVQVAPVLPHVPHEPGGGFVDSLLHLGDGDRRADLGRDYGETEAGEAHSEHSQVKHDTPGHAGRLEALNPGSGGGLPRRLPPRRWR